MKDVHLISLQVVQPNESRLKCFKCEKVFNTESLKFEHLQIDHSNETLETEEKDLEMDQEDAIHSDQDEEDRQSEQTLEPKIETVEVETDHISNKSGTRNEDHRKPGIFVKKDVKTLNNH